MKLAIGFSTKDQVELTRETFARLKFPAHGDLYWCDGSASDEGRALPAKFGQSAHRVIGGPDAGIAWKLSHILNHSPPQHPAYTHIMLLENDVLLDEDWFEPTMELFEKGKRDGLEVGAVSPRSYVDRVLVQRDGYAIMHNIGAGVVVFTRQAATLVLRSFRTHWWQDNVRLFAGLAGTDLRTYAAFRGNEQWVTTDWGWEAQLARHGFASLALTPARCQMIGQKIPLEKQGLELTTQSGIGAMLDGSYGNSFERYRDNLAAIRAGRYKVPGPGVIYRDGNSQLFFPHQLGNLAGKPQWAGNLALKWSQGFGPFVYRAGPQGASLSARISGTCSFLVTGGRVGSRVTVTDTRSGFRFAPDLPPEGDEGQPGNVTVPGGPIPRLVNLDMAEGAVFYGLHCQSEQMLDDTFRFDWTQLPAASGEA